MLVTAHAGGLLGCWLVPRGIKFLPGLNAVLAVTVLIYAISRARYILASADWPFLGLTVFELLVLLGAIFAYRDNRVAQIWSYAAFGLHALGSIAALIFVFLFKLTKLM